jgi:hypothetical protein
MEVKLFSLIHEGDTRAVLETMKKSHEIAKKDFGI